jgi:guanylate kinase
LLVVISGPSGVGKDAVLHRLKELGRPYHFVVTATTRPPRPAERDGVDYHFMTQERFDRLIHQAELLEWARVYSYCYGVPKQQVREALASGRHVLVRTDVQGADSIRKLAPHGVFIFLSPPSLGELEQRLRARGANGPADLALRLDKAREEMAASERFDYVVVNHQGRLDHTVETVEAIIRAEAHLAVPRRVSI